MQMPCRLTRVKAVNRNRDQVASKLIGTILRTFPRLKQASPSHKDQGKASSLSNTRGEAPPRSLEDRVDVSLSL